MENNLIYGIVFLVFVSSFVILHRMTVRKLKRHIQMLDFGREKNQLDWQEIFYIEKVHKAEKRVLQTEIKYLKEQVELLKRKR